MTSMMNIWALNENVHGVCSEQENSDRNGRWILGNMRMAAQLINNADHKTFCQKHSV